MELIYQGVVDRRAVARALGRDVLAPRRRGCSGCTRRRASSRPAPTPTSSSTTRTARPTIGINDKHHMNMDYSAWEGFEIDGKVDTVLSRGTVVVENGSTRHARATGSYLRRGLSGYLQWLRQRTEGSTMDFGVVLQHDPPAPGGSSSWPARPRRPASATCGPSTRTCSGRSRTSSTARSWPRPARSSSARWSPTRRTRDWTVTASHLRHAQRDVRQPHDLRHRPRRLRASGSPTAAADDPGRAARVDRRSSASSANGREVDYKGSDAAVPVGPSSSSSTSGSPPTARRRSQLTGEVGDGFILQLADPDIAAWTIAAVRDGGRRRPAGTRTASRSASPRPAYVGDDLAHQRDQCRWFGGMVGNHVADIVARYGDDGGRCPKALTDYIEGRQGYDYNEHGRAGNTHADFVPDEIVDRFCVLGPVEAHIERLTRAARSSASTSSRSTCSTTTRTRRSTRTASTSSRPWADVDIVRILCEASPRFVDRGNDAMFERIVVGVSQVESATRAAEAALALAELATPRCTWSAPST